MEELHALRPAILAEEGTEMGEAVVHLFGACGADFVQLLQHASMEAYETLAREMFHDDLNVKAFRTIIATREVVDAADVKPSALI